MWEAYGLVLVLLSPLGTGAGMQAHNAQRVIVGNNRESVLRFLKCHSLEQRGLVGTQVPPLSFGTKILPKFPGAFENHLIRTSHTPWTTRALHPPPAAQTHPLGFLGHVHPPVPQTQPAFLKAGSHSH